MILVFRDESIGLVKIPKKKRGANVKKYETHLYPTCL